MQENIEQLVWRVRFQRVPPTGKILRVFQQMAAQCQPVQLLFSRKFAWGYSFEHTERTSPSFLSLAMEGEVRAPQLSFAGPKPGIRRCKRRQIRQQGFKVTGKQSLELSRRSIHG